MAEIQARIHQDGIAFAYAYPSGVVRRISPLRFTAKGFSHFDFDGSNILVDGDAVACVLDFEGARYDSLVVCTYYTLAQLHVVLGDPKKLEHYLESYQKIRKLPKAEKLILRIALALRFRAPKMLRLAA
jgi:Ser/Thr protein kinase RdoA (MazF antagonist)